MQHPVMEDSWNGRGNWRDSKSFKDVLLRERCFKETKFLQDDTKTKKAACLA